MRASRGFYLVSTILQLICWVAMIWPGALLANRVEPLIWGLPFIFFWYIAWIFIMFLGLVVLYFVEHLNKGP
ncbi:hypothetical protein [Castellaniella sp.]|uniref:hypothetical protein n=1 Tax=Castellaniella sp. TaxID=1955812 RepID=UPI0035628E3E